MFDWLATWLDVFESDPDLAYNDDERAALVARLFLLAGAAGRGEGADDAGAGGAGQGVEP